MFGRSFGEYAQLAKFGFIIILIVTIGRWTLSLMGVPYFPRGHVFFSIVLASIFLALAYGGFSRRYLGFGWRQAMVLMVLLAVYAQVLILISTVISYGAGIETYFNHPEALNVEAAIPFGEALTARILGVVFFPINLIVAGSLGYWLGGQLPALSSND